MLPRRYPEKLIGAPDMLLELSKCYPVNTRIWDKGDRTSVKGLLARKLKSGAWSWYVFYRTRTGQQRKPSIGEYPGVSLSSARSRARTILDRVAAGEDPGGEWAAAKAELTVAELFAQVHARHWSQERYQVSGWAKEAKRVYTSLCEKEFGGDRLSAVTGKRAKDWHAGLVEKNGPIAANHALAVIRKIYYWSEENEIRPQNTNPFALVTLAPKKKRKRFATPEELSRLGAVLEQERKRKPMHAAFIMLLMFCGIRPKVLRRLKWTCLREIPVDGERFGVLEFSGKTTSETGDMEVVTLPPAAMEILDQLPRKREEILGGAMPWTWWRRVRAEIGAPDLWMRDLRRTFATVGLSHGASLGLIGELLNHKSAQTTTVYAKLIQGSRQQATANIAGHIQEMMKSK